MPVFVSHSQKDGAVYSTLCMALDAAGVKRWDPAEMSPGESLADQLQKAILRCEVCIFLATRRSIESPWCLAELGAFWGVGKRVIIFLTDPDLTDAVLPPQFKGNLRVGNAKKLVDVAREFMDHYNTSQLPRYEFFENSGSYGGDGDWGKLLDDTTQCFDILGITLKAWREMNNSEEKFMQKAASGCKIRVLLMSRENEMLSKILLSNHKKPASIIHDIAASSEYYSHLAGRSENISVEKLSRGMPHFFVTKTDLCAIIIQYTSSLDWGNGPTWPCSINSPLYRMAHREFEQLWAIGTEVAA